MKDSVLDKILTIRTEDISVVDNCDLDEQRFLKEFVDPNKPCLIKGAISHWPALTTWRKNNYLENLVGDEMVTIYPHMNFIDHKRMAQDAIEVSYREALAMVKANELEVASVPSVPITQSRFSQLKSDMDGFEFVRRALQSRAYPEQRFFTYRSASTGWHLHDYDETLMCQVKGAKKVGLVGSKNEHYSKIRQWSENDEYLDGGSCFEELAGSVDVHVVTVDEGDALYIPPYWWHGVDTADQEFGVTVAQCFRSPNHKLGDLRFPIVRDHWKFALSNPSSYIFKMLGYTIMGSLSRIVNRH